MVINNIILPQIWGFVVVGCSLVAVVGCSLVVVVGCSLVVVVGCSLAPAASAAVVAGAYLWKQRFAEDCFARHLRCVCCEPCPVLVLAAWVFHPACSSVSFSGPIRVVGGGVRQARCFGHPALGSASPVSCCCFLLWSLQAFVLAERAVNILGAIWAVAAAFLGSACGHVAEWSHCCCFPRAWRARCC